MDRFVELSRRDGLKFFALALVLGILYFWQLGARPFATPDEGRYVEIPREMVASGNWVTPRLNGVKYFEKPPLLYWIQAVTQTFAGLDEGWSRVPIVIFALMGLLSSALFAWRHLGKQEGIFTFFILGTSVLYFSLSRLIILDMTLSTFVTLALLSFYQGFYESPQSYRRRLWMYAFSAFCALGVLTKGIVMLALCGPIIVIWLTVNKLWNQLLPLYWPSAILVFLAIAVPWHALAASDNPDFLEKYFYVEHFLRYTTTLHMRHQPIWYFIPIVLVGFLPWSGLMVGALKDSSAQIKSNPLINYLLIWAVWIFGFFSISNSKLIPYILPIFAPLAIMCAHYFCRITSKGAARILGISLLFFGVLLFIAQFFESELRGEKADLNIYLHFIALVYFLGGATLLAYKNVPSTIIVSTTVITQLIASLALMKGGEILQKPSVKELAHIINARKKEGDKVVSFIHYFQDLPVYTNQIVTVVEFLGELEFGILAEDTSGWMINRAQFMELWQKERVWAVGKEAEVIAFQKGNPNFKYRVIEKKQGNILFTNTQEIGGHK